MNSLFASGLIRSMLVILGAAFFFSQDSVHGATNNEKSSINEKIGVSNAKKFIFLFTNGERKKKGLPLLSPSAGLDNAAKNQSKNMCAVGLLAHESPAFPKGWRTFSERLKRADVQSGAENIAFRTFSDDGETWAKKVVRDWIRSPGHRKNLLNPKYRFLGIGVVRCGNNLGYATQIFSSGPGRIP